MEQHRYNVPQHVFPLIIYSFSSFILVINTRRNWHLQPIFVLPEWPYQLHTYYRFIRKSVPDDMSRDDDYFRNRGHYICTSKIILINHKYSHIFIFVIKLKHNMNIYFFMNLIDRLMRLLLRQKEYYEAPELEGPGTLFWNTLYVNVFLPAITYSVEFHIGSVHHTTLNNRHFISVFFSSRTTKNGGGIHWIKKKKLFLKNSRNTRKNRIKIFACYFQCLEVSINRKS